MLPQKLAHDGRTAAAPVTASRTPSLFSLAGRTILITGAARGLGITLAAAVLECCGHCACVDTLPEPSEPEWSALQSLARTSSPPLTLTYHRADVTDEAALSAAVATIAESARLNGTPLRGAVACAGIQKTTLALDYTLEDWNRMMSVNVAGVFLTAKHVARSMVDQRLSGSLVLVASMSGQIANRGLYCSAYNTSKAAVQQMARSLAQEWGSHGIRVNSLSPGYIRTAMTDMLLADQPEYMDTWMRGALLGRLGVPTDFKAPTVYLLADGSAFMTGTDLRVDGGHCAAS